MNTGALLDELRGNILRDVSTAITPSRADFLWSDDTLVRYINQAYFRLARRAYCIVDRSTPEITQLYLKDGVAGYDLHQKVLFVRAARLYGDPVDLVRTTREALNGAPEPDLTYQPYLAQLVSGRPGAYATDFGVRRITFYKTPNIDFDAKRVDLTVARLPKELLSLNSTTEPELDEDVQLDMLEWATYLALRNHDPDGENLAKAKQHEMRFNDAVKELLDDADRADYAPVQYGVGRSGFTWR